ncbi:MAG: carboxypeptidase-like regulatory domain-containing protein, partial [Flavobacteriaceae bacterium]
MNQIKIKTVLLVFSFLFSGLIFAQQTISGSVTDESGLPLPGATVAVEGTSTGTTTDFDGNYSIEASDGQILVISYVGYSTVSVAVASGADYSVSLKPDQLLEEVVVTALGIEKNSKALGYSVTQVGGEEVNEIKSTNAINALQGKIAGVQITGNATGAKGSSRVIIRGNSSLSGNNMPLYVIDGIPIDNTNLGSAGVWGGADAGDGISALNPDEVLSISVLKGGAAAALYGSRASNGVILITTKSGKGTEGIQVEVNSSVQFDDIRNDPFDPQRTYGQGRDYSKTSDNADTYANW